ncbi:iron chelate uptake ABC transporter family permease subunit [Sinorhizobium meliloti]|jgi:iron complex transport system permease protein|uniref:FecCD family ABC transporter permease n=1 Tax=Rhizobium meliloti TaxID=382 RepID=UPI0003FD26FD|nr:iron ABC transporter permease [Sinorhizobium meliloti]ASQ06994.1 iron ABC transporter permease [Sinorhizobium meliloti]ASQ13357.1 iron ABC transporter permease [Sinorhizobium meliloti]ATA95745.1 ferrichrome ABC transporter permease [Sinorhizobium meliloti]MCO6424670.1 iron ABC transporter permease [Sinorhizobium meliloti]MDE3762424.1 iron ABC transporter permease [Sinorhizobium meliloti]
MTSDPLVLTRPKPWLLPAVILLVLFSFVAAVFLGVVDIPAADVASVLTGSGSPEARSIVLDIRLPRIVTGILAGIQFAVAGLLLQTITRNPLADPSLMGVSQGATLTVTVFLLFTVYIFNPGSNTVAELPIAWLPPAGMAGGLAAGGIIYLMAFRLDLSPLRITLCGIAIGAVLHALAIGLIAGWGSARIEIILEWLSGSLYARTWDHAIFLLPFTIAGLTILPLIYRPLVLLQFDSAVARSFGLSYRKQFSLALLVSCALAASAVGAVGPIVFVGLMVPHLARFLAGRNFPLVLPLTVVLGAVIVTLADLIGRLVGHAEEVPIGVVTAIVGVPVLLTLLRKAA